VKPVTSGPVWIDVCPPHGVWFDVGENEPEIVKELSQRGVLVRAGKALGREGALRVTVGTQAENERLVEALGTLL
jgi:histidinol-phosphate aminotransferase